MMSYLTTKRYLRIFSGLVLPLVLSACSTLSGDNVSDAEINADSAKAYEKVKAESKISTNKKWNEIVKRVADKIAKASGEPFAWEVVLIENNEPNAWCMPGGKMAVYTGIMPIVKNEAALAAVLGHEVAHATRRHGKQRYARAIRGQTAGLIVGIATAAAGQFFCKSDVCKYATAGAGAVSALAITFFDRKFSREDETEADQVGQRYMALAGYDPHEASQLWVRMQKASGGKGPPEFLSTHPANERRRANLEEWLPAANAEYQKANPKLGLGEAT